MASEQTSTTVQRSELRDAFEAFAKEALEVYRRHYGEPLLVKRPAGGLRWARSGQETFKLATRTMFMGWPRSTEPPAIETLSTYEALRAALNADPWIGRQFDQLVGSPRLTDPHGSEHHPALPSS
jgi:hypothetical protein